MRDRALTERLKHEHRMIQVGDRLGLAASKREKDQAIMARFRMQREREARKERR